MRSIPAAYEAETDEVSAAGSADDEVPEAGSREKTLESPELGAVTVADN